MKKLLITLALLFAAGSAFAGNVGLGNLDANGNAQVRLFDSSGNPLGTTTNPLSTGGTYNSTPPTLTNGQGASLQLNASGGLLTADGLADAALGTPADAACGSCTNGTVAALLKQALVALGNPLPAGTNTIGGAFVVPPSTVTTAMQPSTFHYTSVATAPAGVKIGSSAPHLIYFMSLVNTAAYSVTLHFYNSANPTCGSGTVIWSVTVPAGQSIVESSAIGIPGGAGNTSFCVTKLPGDTDATAVAAGDLVASFAYQ